MTMVARFHHIYLLGVAIKLGGCVNSWHNGYIVGLWGYFCVCLIVASGYISLNLCVAEITSITTFPGGHFGYVRASVGPFWGYVAGVMGLIESIYFLAVSMLKLGQACTTTFATDRQFELLWWTISYISLMIVYVRGGMTLWNFLGVIAVITISTMVIYLFGSTPALDVPKYGYSNSDNGFTGDAIDFFLVMRLPCWLFVGIDLLPLTAEEVHEAIVVVPKAIIAVLATMVVTSIWLEISVAAQAPGLVPDFFGLDNVFPLSPGFANMFGISTRWATAFAILPCFGSCVGFMYVASRQVNAMARSGLLPAVLKGAYGENDTPLAAMLAVSVVGLVSLPFAWTFDPHTLLFRMAVSGGCVAYVLVLVSFLQFRTTYSHMPRTFINPLSRASALYGILCFAVIWVSVLFVLPLRSNFNHTIAFGCISVAMLVYYYAVVIHCQTFSPEEQDKFMKAYIVNANAISKKRLKSPFNAHKSGWLGFLPKYQSGRNRSKGSFSMAVNGAAVTVTHATNTTQSAATVVTAALGGNIENSSYLIPPSELEETAGVNDSALPRQQLSSKEQQERNREVQFGVFQFRATELCGAAWQSESGDKVYEF